MNDSLNHFLDTLANTRVEGPVFNQYALEEDPALSEANAIRRENLDLYLRQMVAARPVLLLVGEAPGYKGCRLTGVPFASETILLNEHMCLFGQQRGFRRTNELRRISAEATATMVWSAVSGTWPPPLFWNAFPFHPHRPDRPQSNRRPCKEELDTGTRLLNQLTAIFQLKAVAAVGRIAEKALNDVGLRDYYVLRHPSHGGKAAFNAGLQQIMMDLSR